MYKLANMLLVCTLLYILPQSRAFALVRTERMVQDSSKMIVLYFRFDRSLLEKDYMTNAQTLEELRKIMLEPGIAHKMDSIVVKAAASPEGSLVRNNQLSEERAAAVKSYLMWQYPFLDRNRILTYAIGENWQGLYQMVEQDPDVPFRNEVINIISSSENPQTKDARLQELGGGEAFAYITRRMLRFLRSGTANIFFYRHPEEKQITITEMHPAEKEQQDTIPEIQVAEPVPPTTEMIEYTEYNTVYRRPIAFKTNLLFDAATLLNAEVEVPLSTRFSMAGELLFPWWLWKNQQNCLEILSGTLEGRYWLKPNYSRQDVSLGRHNPLTGWFLGIYGSIGKYDLEWKKSGYQGEFYYSAGLSFGYVLPVRRNLNMEFSLSAGYLQTDYWHYQACQATDGEWYLMKQYPGTFRWIGPTRLKISLIWYPHFKAGRKGGGVK